MQPQTIAQRSSLSWSHVSRHLHQRIYDDIDNAVHNARALVFVHVKMPSTRYEEDLTRAGDGKFLSNKQGIYFQHSHNRLRS